MKNFLKVLSIALLCLLLNSCLTRIVMKDSKYNETFYGHFISKYGNDVVFIGKKYHYVFSDNSGQIAKFAKPQWLPKLKLSEINLTANAQDEVSGNAVLQIINSNTKTFPQNEIVLAKAEGFNYDRNNVLSKKIELKGVRYKPNPNYNYQEKMSFSREYKVAVNYQGGKLEKAKKTAITPVAFVADGALILAGGVWVPLIIIAFTDENTHEKVIERIKEVKIVQ